MHTRASSCDDRSTLSYVAPCTLSVPIGSRVLLRYTPRSYIGTTPVNHSGHHSVTLAAAPYGDRTYERSGSDVVGRLHMSRLRVATHHSH
jgi:hypothetical protein